MNELLLPIVLQLLGVAVIIAEIFIPSLGLLTVIAVSLLGYSLYLVFTTISPTVGWILTGVDLVLVPTLLFLGIKLIARSNLSLKTQLSQVNGVESQSKNLQKHLNKKGRAITDLRPAGMALIDELRLDVVTDGEYLEEGTSVKVVRITGNQIIVEQIT